MPTPSPTQRAHDTFKEIVDVPILIQTAAKIKTYRVIFGFPDLESNIFDFLAVFHE